MTRGAPKRVLLLSLCGLFALLFGGLGIWQVERLQWKLDLIHRVEARLAAPPVAPPAPGEWATLAPTDIDYRRVVVSGRFADDQATRVDALTELGPGWWVLTPLRTATGTILVNRGFVPKKTAFAPSPAGVVSVTGLLRPSEPGGRVLRPNRPAKDLFYSRDVAAIAARRGLGKVAPFFIDAAAARGQAGWPRGGMTVVRFRNAHLVYALTWFGLAALSIVGLVLVWKSPDSHP